MIVLTVGCGHDGRLGHGTDRNEAIPRRVLFFEGKDVLSVSAGGYHTFFVCKDHVFAVGFNDSGQLGFGTKLSCQLPRIVPDLHPGRVSSLSLGRYHSVALQRDGTVHTCGENKNGQLGHGDYEPRARFCQVDALNSFRVVAASAGAYHTLFGVAADAPLTMEVWSCGKGDSGELGYNPDAVHTLSRIDQRVKSTNWTLESTQEKASFAQSYTAAVAPVKKKTTEPPRRLEVDCAKPRMVSVPFALEISTTRLHAGYHHSAVSCPPFVFHFGCRYDGVPDGEASSVAVPFLPTPTAMAMGEDMLSVRTEDGSLMVMGKGLLGAEEQEYTSGFVTVGTGMCPPTITGVGKFVVAWGGCAGSGVVALGDNYMGQCGVGHETDLVEPTPVMLPPDCGHVVEVSCGVRHTVFLCEKK